MNRLSVGGVSSGNSSQFGLPLVTARLESVGVFSQRFIADSLHQKLLLVVKQLLTGYDAVSE